MPLVHATPSVDRPLVDDGPGTRDEVLRMKIRHDTRVIDHDRDTISDLVGIFGADR